MLKIHIPASEYWDPKNECFVTSKEQDLTLEHSLVSISKWEAKWHKAFLKEDQKTDEEIRDYIRCMTLTQNVDPSVYDYIPPEVGEQIAKYINDPMTATTWFGEEQKKGGAKDTVTSELIYYWMIAMNIPMECQKWHLNRLLTLIKVCEKKNNPGKMGKGDIMRRNRELNAARRKAHKSRG